MKSEDKNLKHQLKQAGASEKEVKELSGLARSLSKLEGQESHSKARSRLGRRKGRRLFIPVGLSALIGVSFGMALVILSQPVLPGSMLYPIEKLSDNTAISLNSDYRGTVMMKRAQQVKELVADNASSSLVMATLNDYKVEAAAYKSTKDSYPAFEYCETNLEQAASMAGAPIKQSINNALESLSDAS